MFPLDFVVRAALEFEPHLEVGGLICMMGFLEMVEFEASRGTKIKGANLAEVQSVVEGLEDKLGPAFERNHQLRALWSDWRTRNIRILV